MKGKRAAVRAIGERAHDVWRRDPVQYDDPATRGHHWAACLVLASDELLRSPLPDQEHRLRVIETALLTPGAGAVKFFTRMMLLFSWDRFRTLARYAEDSVPPRYGSAFRFETLEKTPDSFVQGVMKCFYNDFFRSAGSPHLIGLFCAYDRLWIDEIDPVRDRVRFERPVTLAAGGSHCSFEFYRHQGRTEGC